MADVDWHLYGYALGGAETPEGQRALVRALFKLNLISKRRLDLIEQRITERAKRTPHHREVEK